MQQRTNDMMTFFPPYYTPRRDPSITRNTIFSEPPPRSPRDAAVVRRNMTSTPISSARPRSRSRARSQGQGHGSEDKEKTEKRPATHPNSESTEAETKDSKNLTKKVPRHAISAKPYKEILKDLERSIRDDGSKNKKQPDIPVKKPLTQVVLPPRFKASEVKGQDSGTRRPGGSRSLPRPKLPIKGIEVLSKPSDPSLHEMRKRVPVQLQLQRFAPQKAKWVFLALERLVRNGTITKQQALQPDLQSRVGALYDAALDKKIVQMESILNHLLLDSLEREKERKRSATLFAKIQSEIQGKDEEASTDKDVQRKVSDLMLYLLLKGMMADAEDKDQNQGKDETLQDKDTTTLSGLYNTLSGSKLSESFLSNLKGALTGSSVIGGTKEMKHVWTNTEFDKDADSGVKRVGSETNEKEKSPNSTRKWDKREVSPWVKALAHDAKEVKNCVVLEGKVCPLDQEKKIVNSFASLVESRRRLDPGSSDYFRRVADVRGFSNEEIVIRYAKNKVFIEARQAPTSEQNYRLVREMITLPPDLRVIDLKVLRARNNGRLIFEEVPNSKRSFGSGRENPSVSTANANANSLQESGK